jgi:hypothetical protein
MVGLFIGTLGASELDLSRCSITGPNQAELRLAVDNDDTTFWQSPGHQKPGLRVVIDLKKSVYVHRVFMSAGARESWFPRSLRVLVGETLGSLKVVAEQNLQEEPDNSKKYWLRHTFHPETNLKFAPTRGRYVRLEIGHNSAGYPWAIAELEVYAATKEVSPEEWNAVVVDSEANSTLKLAAEELRHYLTEGLNVPAKIVSPEDAEGSQGLRVRLESPEPPKLPYSENDPANVEDVSVTKEKNDIVISGPTSRAVLYGAYELLHRIGVRWVYPGPHGDVVPSLRKIPDSIFPIKYRPPFRTRYANFGVGSLATHTKTEDGFLFFVRHHFNNTWGGSLRGTLSGTPPRMNLGFGYIHNLRLIVPDNVLKEHPDWLPGRYRKGSKVPCTTNPEFINFVVKRIKEESEKKPELQGFSIHPMDGPSFCECARCEKAFGKPKKVREVADDMAHAFDYSSHYMHLIDQVARRVKKELPGKGILAVAYANHGKPPEHIRNLPDNVMVDVTLHWEHNLPVDSPVNSSHKKEIEEWAFRCSQLGIYDYCLIHMDTTYGRPAGEWFTLVPLVSPIADHHRFFNKLGVTSVGTQAMGDICWTSPWSVYAYSRTAWNPNEPVEDIKKDFFGGFYGRAGRAMRKWYETFESHVVENHIDLGGGVGTFSPVKAAYPEEVVGKMRRYLDQAERKARKWYVRKRVAHARLCTEWSYRKAHELDATPTYPCYRVASAPTIDGRLDDAAWQSLPAQTGFRIATVADFAQTRQTTFRVGWDSDFLYFGIRCEESAVDAVKKRNPQQKGYLDIADASWSKFYHDLLEIFLASEEHVYYQAMINANGQFIGPIHMERSMHNRTPFPDGFECKTSLDRDSWSAEAKWPFATLGKTPQDGTKWKTSIIRVSSQEKSNGEQFTSWPRLQRLNFHDRRQYNRIQFLGQPPKQEALKKIAAELNDKFVQSKQVFSEFQKRRAAFDAAIKGQKDVCQLGKGIRVVGPGRNHPSLLKADGSGKWQRYGKLPQVADIRWEKPVELTAVRLTWGSRKVYPTWYGLEWFDGQTYRPLVEETDNAYESSFHEFDAVTTTRFRLKVFKIDGGSSVTLARQIEAFGRVAE